MSESRYHHLAADTIKGVLVLTIAEKELRDYDVCKALESEMIDAMSRFEAKKIALDFRNVDYMASVGFMSLIGFNHKLRKFGGRLVVCNLSRWVADVFASTRLLTGGSARAAPFKGTPDLEAAIAELNEAPSEQ
jgi:anti-anti-sigma factor